MMLRSFWISQSGKHVLQGLHSFSNAIKGPSMNIACHIAAVEQ